MTGRRNRGAGTPYGARLDPTSRPAPPESKPIYLHRCLVCTMNNPTPQRECPKICEWCGEKLVTDELVIRDELRLGKRGYTEDYRR